MKALLLGIILTIIPIPGGDPAARLEFPAKSCRRIQRVLPQSRCAWDKGMFTVHVSSRSDFNDPIIKKALEVELEAWFEAGGDLFALHFREQEEFVICITRKDGYNCYDAHRVKKDVDITPSNGHDAPRKRF
ncbi:MAG: hypothetical protein V3S55_07745 [Nitrospiraceae bacterium]